MNNAQISESLEQKREGYLARACAAESENNFFEAERLFRLALYCDGRIRLDIADAKKYVEQAGPLYKPSTVVVGA
jgi:hypothetical protein